MSSRPLFELSPRLPTATNQRAGCGPEEPLVPPLVADCSWSSRERRLGRLSVTNWRTSASSSSASASSFPISAGRSAACILLRPRPTSVEAAV
jgi:hypothetical protein